MIFFPHLRSPSGLFSICVPQVATKKTETWCCNPGSQLSSFYSSPRILESQGPCQGVSRWGYLGNRGFQTYQQYLSPKPSGSTSSKRIAWLVLLKSKWLPSRPCRPGERYRAEAWPMQQPGPCRWKDLAVGTLWHVLRQPVRGCQWLFPPAAVVSAPSRQRRP